VKVHFACARPDDTMRALTPVNMRLKGNATIQRSSYGTTRSSSSCQHL